MIYPNLYLKLFWTFFKIGAFTFGGGYAMLPLILTEVAKNKWLSEEELINFIAVSESTPGPFAVNVSTYVGTEVAGVAGAFFATLGVVLPSFIIILIIAHCFDKFKESFIIKNCMTGLKPAVIGLIGSAIISTGRTVLFPTGYSVTQITNGNFLCSVAIFLGMTLFAFKKVHPIVIIVVSAIIGTMYPST